MECIFPSKEETLSIDKLNILIDKNNEKMNTKKLSLEYLLNNMINYCLIDGKHLSDKDPDFFLFMIFQKYYIVYLIIYKKY